MVGEGPPPHDERKTPRTRGVGWDEDGGRFPEVKRVSPSSPQSRLRQKNETLVFANEELMHRNAVLVEGLNDAASEIDELLGKCAAAHQTIHEKDGLIGGLREKLDFVMERVRALEENIAGWLSGNNALWVPPRGEDADMAALLSAVGSPVGRQLVSE